MFFRPQKPEISYEKGTHLNFIFAVGKLNAVSRDYGLGL
jgi:hypothetical protein